MALLPYALRPSVVIRRKAIWSGLLGPSTFWKIVAVGVLGKSSLQKFFGKNDEVITVETVGTNAFLRVQNTAPLSRKEQKRTGITRKVLVQQALADVAVAHAARPAKKKRFRRAR